MLRHVRMFAWILTITIGWMVTAEEKAPVPPVLRPGYIQVVCEPGVEVYLDGKLKGTATEELGGWIIQDVVPGPHIITAVKTGFRSQQVELDVKSGDVHLFRVPPFRERAPAPQTDKNEASAISQHTGTLVIRTLPVECRFRIEGLGIDSEKSSTEWRNTNVPAGNYDVEVTALGRVLKQAVTVSENATVEMLFNFLRREVKVYADAGKKNADGDGKSDLPLLEQIRTGEKALAAVEAELKQVRQLLKSKEQNITMKQLRTLVARRDELDHKAQRYRYRLQVLKQRVELEKKGIQEEEARRRHKEFAREYAEFRQLEKDPDVGQNLKLKAWNQLCRKWGVDPGDRLGRLLWDDETGKPYKVLVYSMSLAPDVSMELVRIKGGTFRMGSDEGDGDEKPVHDVTITHTFWMGKYEVTQAQYQTVMGKNPSFFSGENRPVETVSWYDAQAFCEKLNDILRRGRGLPKGYEFRLPTEAEWEYACRAGSSTPFSFGTVLDLSEANFEPSREQLREFGITKTQRETLPVGSFKANNWDLCDMHGNVWEWCLDWYDREYYARSPGLDPFNRRPSDSRVCRGGSYAHPASFSRSANRKYLEPRQAIHMLGFRVVLGPVPGELGPDAE